MPVPPEAAADVSVDSEVEAPTAPVMVPVVAPVVSRGNPARVARAPVPVDVRHRETLAGEPDPAPVRVEVPVPVVVGHPAPWFVRDPEHPAGRVPPAPVPVRRPARGHTRPPCDPGARLHPRPVPSERRCGVVEVRIHVSGVLAARLVAEPLAPRLQAVETRGRREAEPAAFRTLDEETLSAANLGEFRLRRDFRRSLAYDDLTAALVVDDDQEGTRPPRPDRRVRRDDGGPLGARRVRGHHELQRPAREFDDGGGVARIRRVGECAEEKFRPVPDPDEVAVGERDFDARFAGCEDPVADEDGFVHREMDALPGVSLNERRGAVHRPQVPVAAVDSALRDRGVIVDRGGRLLGGDRGRGERDAPRHPHRPHPPPAPQPPGGLRVSCRLCEPHPKLPCSPVPAPDGRFAAGSVPQRLDGPRGKSVTGG